MRILKNAPLRKGRRRMLLLSYHFPPSETAGSLRWQRLADSLAEAGWSLDVITKELHELTDSGRNALEGLNADVRVFGVPEGQFWTREFSRSISRRLKALWHTDPGDAGEGGGVERSRPGSFHRSEIGWRPLGESIRRAYGASFKLNLERGWAKAAEQAAESLLDEPGAEYEAIVTCGPPHLVHVAGLRLHRKTGVPFVMDTRDPWRFVERLPESIASPVWLSVSRFFEVRCVREAALVITNTEPAAELLRRTYPGLGPFLAIRNGSDTVRPPPRDRSGPFTLVFAGSIYLDRDPRPLFEAASRLVSERQLTPNEFRIILVGSVSEYEGRPVRELAASAGIAEHLDLRTTVPRAELASILATASVLVSLPQDSHLAIPSKIYEYAEFPAWMLAISEPGSATGRLLAGTGADLVAPGSPDAIYEALAARQEEYEAGQRPRPLAENPKFQRSAQAARLVDALEVVAGSRQSPRSTPS